MSLMLIFWVLMLLWLIFGLWQNWPGAAAPPWGPLGSAILLFVLFLVLGWAVFGAPVKG